MVEIKIQKGYTCPYCNKFYINYDEADDCAIACINRESPIDSDKTIFRCEMCHEEYDNNGRAEHCEAMHKRDNDRFLEQYNDRKAKERLLDAGNHPNQKKLSLRGK